MAKEDEVTFDTILETLGTTGRFQLMQIFITLMSRVTVTYMSLSFVFLGYEPPHVCSPINETKVLEDEDLHNDSSVTFKYDSCKVTVSANQSGNYSDVTELTCLNGRTFVDGDATTYLSDWDLVCESTGIAEWSQTLLTVGQITGVLIFSSISDRFGRKPVFLVTSTTIFLGESTVLIAPSIYVIYVLKFLSGVAWSGFLTTFMVHNMELLVPRHRQVYGTIIGFTWSMSHLTMGGFAYLLRYHNWRHFQAILAASGIVCLANPFLFHESLRWLATNGRVEQAQSLLKKACKQNGKEFEPLRKLLVKFMDEDTKKSNLIEKKESFLTLFKDRDLRITTLVALFLFITNKVTYYGLFMTSSSIAGDRFLNYTLMALVELPCNGVLLVLLNRIKRRLVLIIFLLVSGMSFLATVLLLSTFGKDFEYNGYISTSLFILGKFTISIAYGTTCIVVPEMFPTNLRSTGLGFCHCFGSIGILISPFLRQFSQVAEWAPGLVFTSMCIVAACLIPLLPETKDKSLPDSIGEANEMKKI